MAVIAPLEKIFHFIEEYLTKVMKLLLIIMSATMFIVVLLGIVARWTGTSMAFTQELAEFVFVWGSLIGTFLVYQEKGHINIDVFNTLIPPKILAVLIFLGELALAAFLLFLISSGITMAQGLWTTTSQVLFINIGLQSLLLPFISACILLNQFNRLLSGLRKVLSPAEVNAGGEFK